MIRFQRKRVSALILLVSLGFLIGVTEGLVCNVCQYCTDKSAVSVDCSELLILAKELGEDNALVCDKITHLGVRITKGCQVVRKARIGCNKETLGGMEENQHECFCDEDNCNHGSKPFRPNFATVAGISIFLIIFNLIS